ncbi:MAG TPA: hypothetical protein VMH22_15145, partial [bacterium]|nr:hypothetical protein [bacterium]
WNSPGTLYVECAKVGNRWLDEARVHTAPSLHSIPNRYNQPIPQMLTFGGRSLPRVPACVYLITNETGWDLGDTIHIAMYTVAGQPGPRG